MSFGKRTLGLATVAAVSLTLSLAQSPQRSTAQAMRANFVGVNARILTMAKDFPADKYNFRLKPEMRSYGEVIVHVASGLVFAAKAGRGEKVNWDELNPKDYPNKAAAAALMEKSIADANATLKGVSDAALDKSIEPWIDVMEHSAEHYGLLVAYYRANGIVPPESPPKEPKK